MGKVCYNEHPRGRDWLLVSVLKRGGMWLSKVSRRGFKSNVISNIFIRFCIRCRYLYGAWLFRIFWKWKCWKPLLRLGFQPLLSSVKVLYFLLKSNIVKRLENRLPKRHGGSNPSSCAKNKDTPCGCHLFFATVRGSQIRSPSELARRGVRILAVERVKLACKRQGEKSSPEANTPLPSLPYKLEFISITTA